MVVVGAAVVVVAFCARRLRFGPDLRRVLPLPLPLRRRDLLLRRRVPLLLRRVEPEPLLRRLVGLSVVGGFLVVVGEVSSSTGAVVMGGAIVVVFIFTLRQGQYLATA